VSADATVAAVQAAFVAAMPQLAIDCDFEAKELRATLYDANSTVTDQWDLDVAQATALAPRACMLRVTPIDGDGETVGIDAFTAALVQYTETVVYDPRSTLLVRLWYFDGGDIDITPQHVFSGCSFDAAVQALCDRFGAFMFDTDTELAAMQRGSYVIELPGDSRCAVLITH
jgi:hypothetical protein